MSELNTNSVNPDQTQHSAASDLGLYCLPMSLLWDARLKWVKATGYNRKKIAAILQRDITFADRMLPA